MAAQDLPGNAEPKPIVMAEVREASSGKKRSNIFSVPLWEYRAHCR